MYPNPQDVLPLPPRSSLEQYKKRAKDLVKAGSSSDPDAVRNWIRSWIETLERLARPASAFPVRYADFTNQLEQFIRSRIADSKLSLTQAQFVIARAHGFESWPKLSKHIDDVSRTNSPSAAFELAADAIVDGDLAKLERLLRENPKLVRQRSTREHQATLLIYVAANGVENYRQRTPMNIVAITEALLEAGANVNATANVYGGDRQH